MGSEKKEGRDEEEESEMWKCGGGRAEGEERVGKTEKVGE